MENFPLPEPDSFARPFWDACERFQLEVPMCLSCGHLFLPGAVNCPECWSEDLGTRTLSGIGTVFTFAVYRRTYHPAIPAPYVVALVELHEGLRLVSNIVGCVPEDVQIGMTVQVKFEREGNFTLPRFIPVKKAHQRESQRKKANDR